MEQDAPKWERAEITIYGRVQGVAFRFYTQNEARRLGLTGWVRNNPDGSVRMVAEGDPAVLDVFCAWTAHGPDHARVDRQEVFRSQATGAFDDFIITG